MLSPDESQFGEHDSSSNDNQNNKPNADNESRKSSETNFQRQKIAPPSQPLDTNFALKSTDIQHTMQNLHIFQQIFQNICLTPSLERQAKVNYTAIQLINNIIKEGQKLDNPIFVKELLIKHSNLFLKCITDRDEYKIIFNILKFKVNIDILLSYNLPNAYKKQIKQENDSLLETFPKLKVKNRDATRLIITIYYDVFNSIASNISENISFLSDCLKIISTISQKCSTKLSNEKKILTKFKSIIEIKLALFNKEYDKIEKILNKRIEKNDDLFVTINLYNEICKRLFINNKFHLSPFLFTEPYIYIKEKLLEYSHTLNENKPTNKSNLFSEDERVHYFMESLSYAILYYSTIDKDYYLASKYLLSLVKFLKSPEINSIMQCDFEKIFNADTKEIERLPKYLFCPLLKITEYAQAIERLTPSQKSTNEYLARLRVVMDDTFLKFKQLNLQLIKSLKEVDFNIYLNFKIDILLDYIKTNKIRKARKLKRSIQKEYKNVTDDSVLKKYYIASILYLCNVSPDKPNGHNLLLALSKIKKVIDTTQKIDFAYLNILAFVAKALYKKGDNINALKVLRVFSKYIKVNYLTMTQHNLECLNLKQLIYKDLGYNERYLKISKKIRKIKKILNSNYD